MIFQKNCFELEIVLLIFTRTIITNSCNKNIDVFVERQTKEKVHTTVYRQKNQEWRGVFEDFENFAYLVLGVVQIYILLQFS